MNDMQFLFADGAADVRYGKIEQAAFLAPHIHAIEALAAERWKTHDEKTPIVHTLDGGRARASGDQRASG
jgi:hypothetical protein